MPKAGTVKVETTRGACGEVAAWLRDAYRASMPTLLTDGEDPAIRFALGHVLTRASQRAGPRGFVLELDRAQADWLGGKAPSAALQRPIRGGLFFTDIGPLALAPRAVRDLAEQCATALRVRRGGHNKGQRQAGKISDQRLTILRRQDALAAWFSEVEARGESWVTTRLPLPGRRGWTRRQAAQPENVAFDVLTQLGRRPPRR